MELSIHIDAPATAIWPVLVDVARWPEWTRSMTSVRLLDQEFGLGSSVRIRQPRLPGATWRVTAWEEGHAFTWETRSPGVRTAAAHSITADSSSGSTVTLTIRHQGFLARLFGRWTSGITNRYMAMEAEGLKHRCETGS